MRRVLSVGAGLACAGALATSAVAQDQMPTELWSEYPLVQKVHEVQKVQPTALGPLLPPTRTEAAAAPEGSTRWSLWLAVAAVGTLALLFALRTAAPVVTGTGARLRSLASPRLRKPKPMQLREHPVQPRAPSRRRQGQYATLPPVAVPEPDLEREPRHYVARRTGLLRSHFVVVADEAGGKMSEIERSKSFWRIGDAERTEQAAEEAWFDLVNDLRVAGWEPDSTRPSDFYVLLRRVQTGPASLLPTIEAYTHDEP